MNPLPLREGAGGGGSAAAPRHANRSRQPAAARATFAGAVPPKLVREATEASTVSTENTFSVIAGSTACISASDNSLNPTPRASAAATSRPAT